MACLVPTLESFKATFLDAQGNGKMIWDKPSALRIFFALVIGGFVSGCASIVHSTKSDYESAIDLSDATDVAIIRGVYTTAMAGFMSEDCWIQSPRNAKQITINAGSVDITAACEGFDFFDSPNSGGHFHRLSFRFDALAGHEYAIKRYRATIRLHDMTVKQKLELCTQSSTDACYTDPAAARAEIEEALGPGRIKSTQQMLNLFGYECGEPTGVIDGRTRIAVIDYQFDHRLEITGWIDDSLVTHLETRVADR